MIVEKPAKKYLQISEDHANIQKKKKKNLE